MSGTVRKGFSDSERQEIKQGRVAGIVEAAGFRGAYANVKSRETEERVKKKIRRQLVETGHVDVIISAGNNFFYTKSLPCSLWFFDKGKPEALRDKVLFIDARNYYTVVDRTQNEWTEQQLQNLAAIVWLYRGETDKYRALVEQYAAKPFPRAGRVAHRAGWGRFQVYDIG